MVTTSKVHLLPLPLSMFRKLFTMADRRIRQMLSTNLLAAGPGSVVEERSASAPAIPFTEIARGRVTICYWSYT